MQDGEREAQAIATLTNFATPANIEGILAKTNDLEVIKRHFAQARPLIIAGIAIRSAALARAKELAAGYGAKASEQVGKQFDNMSARDVDRHVQWWREIFQPKIAREGDSVEFVLEEGSWYTIAVQAAPIKETTPLALIEDAEARKRSDPGFRPSTWKRELGLSGDSDEGSTGAPDKAIMRWLKKAAKFETGDGIEFAKNADREMLNVARDALTFAREILDELESRFAGRVEP